MSSHIYALMNLHFQKEVACQWAGVINSIRIWMKSLTYDSMFGFVDA